MSFIGDFLGDTIGGITGAKQAGQAAERGAATQAAAAQAGIEEQRRQFDQLVELMAPFVTAGTGALSAQQALLGLGGPEAERAAIDRISGGIGFQESVKQGEQALLQNAAATGGLRGGNLQAALAQFRPAMLSQAIQQQYGRLGGLTSLGQSSAAGQAAGGMQSADAISNLLANQGAATAGGQVARGNIARQTFGDVLNIAKTGAEAYKAFSDIRLKKNIKQIATRADGLGVYEFDYVWGGARQIGLMAQEVQGVYPDAVSEINGFLAVDYSKV